ncbi:MAG: hypothetical protein K2N88_02820 [Muribaculaceae bacterium]|nr:hypothetical protein [Muribaculaceae bacterium]
MSIDLLSVPVEIIDDNKGAETLGLRIVRVELSNSTRVALQDSSLGEWNNSARVESATSEELYRYLLSHRLLEVKSVSLLPFSGESAGLLMSEYPLRIIRTKSGFSIELVM